MDRASESDRLFFERNPDERVRMRPRIDGEFGPNEYAAPPDAAWTLVVQLAPGVRDRRPFALFGPGLEEAAS